VADDVRVFADTRDVVGECPVWMPEEQALFWVDNEVGTVHRNSVLRQDRWSGPDGARAIAPLSGGQILVVGNATLHVLDPRRGTFQRLCALPPKPGTVWNDARCDPSGSLWLGSIDCEDARPIGVLERVTAVGDRAVMASGYVLTNGLDWSPDGRFLYVTDSARRVIMRYEIEPQGQSLGGATVFVQDDPSGPSLPDGLTVDADGCLWSAKWDGWSVVRYDPTGRAIDTVSLPVARPTSCTLDDAGNLYVTTATYELSQDELRDQPFAGCVLLVHVGIPAQQTRTFGQLL
jgi:Gluconolactonase